MQYFAHQVGLCNINKMWDQISETLAMDLSFNSLKCRRYTGAPV